jgi:PAS domain S-box-containing protein
MSDTARSAPAAAALAALSHDLMAALESDGRIAWANGSWRRLLGWAPEELAGAALPELVEPEDADAARSLARDGGDAVLNVSTRSGGTRSMAFAATAAEGVTYVCGRDATQTRELEHELRAAEDRFRALTGATPEAICVADGRGRITFANHGATTIFGWEPHELLGQPFTILVPERFRDVWAGHLETFLATGFKDLLGRTLELLGARRDGSEFPMEASLGFWERSGRGAFTGIMRDVSERNETLAALERSNAELAEFAYVASHDLSEPLRTITAYLRLLRRRHGEELAPDADGYVGRAIDGAERLRVLIDDLLTYSRVGRSERAAEPVDTAAIVATIAAAVEATREPRPTVEWGDLPTVPGEQRALTQLLQNLISNAIKFVPPGTGPYVRLSAEFEDGAWRFAVDDNGIGIDPRHAEGIFGMFQRLHTREAFPGTGIGLAIARKVVEGHGGRIWAEPRPEGGTRMAFTLPGEPPG